MKFIIAIILTAALSFIGGLYLPWWSLAIAALLVAALVPQKPGKAFLSGALGVFLLWGGMAFWIDMKNNHLLSQKIAAILPLGGNSILLILLTAFIGALVAGVAALCGSYLRISAK